MSDGVKFIFKTLLKVPIIILVTYAIFNAFAFSLSYFKILGFSYVAMQTAVENNYLPTQELNTLTTYLTDLETEMLKDTSLTIDTDLTSPNTADNNKVQYGTTVKITVRAHYDFIWPLQPVEQRTGAAAGGMNNQNIGSELSEAQMDQLRQQYADNTGSYDAQQSNANLADVYGYNDNANIVISYTVPGLKYYPDLN